MNCHFGSSSRPGKLVFLRDLHWKKIICEADFWGGVIQAHQKLTKINEFSFCPVNHAQLRYVQNLNMISYMICKCNIKKHVYVYNVNIYTYVNNSITHNINYNMTNTFIYVYIYINDLYVI